MMIYWLEKLPRKGARALTIVKRICLAKIWVQRKMFAVFLLAGIVFARSYEGSV